MSTIHPALAEHLRKCSTRPDAYRWARPGTPEARLPGWLDPWVTRVRMKEAAEDEARACAAAEEEEFERDVEALRAANARVRIMLADVKFELALRALGRKYSPNQPRVPAGSREGGQWTSGGGQLTVVDGRDHVRISDSRILSDASPDPVRPGAQYAQARIEIHTSALTGIEDIDRTTVALADRLGKVVDGLPEGSGPVYGVMVHTAFKASLLGDPIPNVTVEPTFGGTGIYGSKDSIRPDVVLRGPTGDIVAMYDAKTGAAGIEPPRAARFRAFSTSGVYVIELSVRRGVLLKSRR
jgi:hypothetical protein